MSYRKAFDLASILFSIVGTIFLFFSFEFTSSGINVVHSVADMGGGVTSTVTSWCVGNQILFQFTEKDNGIIMGTEGCPRSSSTQEVALLVANHPILGEIGLSLILIGFFLQIIDWWPERKLSRAERRHPDNR